MNYIPELNECAPPKRLVMVAKLIGKFFDYTIKNLVDLRIHLIAVQEYFICTRWWNLNLTAKRAIKLVAFMLLVCLAASDVRIALGSIFDLVETFFLTIKALDLDHVESVDEERLFDCVVKRTI